MANSDQQLPESSTSRDRAVRLVRFAVVVIGPLVAGSSIAQVYEHWQPGNDNVVLYSLSTFFGFLWSRLLIGAAIGAALMLRLKRPSPAVDTD